jgi:hypothetical protein
MPRQPAIPIDQPWPRIQLWMHDEATTISETHWYNSPSGLAAALTQGTALAAIRRGMLPINCFMTEVRASLENVYRDSLVQTFTGAFGNAGFVAPNSNADSIGIRLESNATVQGLYRRISYLGYVPDDAILAEEYLPGNNVAYNATLQRYMAALMNTANNLGFLAIIKNPGISPRVPVVQVTGTLGTNVCTVTTSAASLLAIGNVFRLTGVATPKGAPTLNRLWVVENIAGNVITFFLDSVLTVNVALNAGGFVMKMLKTFQPYTNSYLDGLRNRKRGGRAFLPLGRSRRRAIVTF